ncbi:hypothetical protein [Saccharomonospora xinjiangensis]|uniref:Uncharacterized protein n=1 Tax=Saccharomonospora xinjiangensis XJ-54 TaxID=882086 RepID=I0UWX7_9PSEU|nr:hypothetical protein [Saccharomonospora xinjiangensis]EID52380.1 hypothetical protein SacxiDRAFT_0096 [Saccharomonospora xinjiangensis XJ-54]
MCGLCAVDEIVVLDAGRVEESSECWAGFPMALYAGAMFGRRQPVQNDAVAKRMRRFFRSGNVHRLSPEQVAMEYGRTLWSRRKAAVADERKLKTERFTVALATGDTGDEFDTITKRATLISDTLLLSHTDSGQFHRLGLQHDLTVSRFSERDRHDLFDATCNADGVLFDYGRNAAELSSTVKVTEKWYGMYCPDLADLGTWIVNAEPLLKAGLAWYLPCYATGYASGTVRPEHQLGMRHLTSHRRYPGVDYLIKDRVAVDASGANPLKSRLVRPVLTVDLPFVDGVGLRDFSDITTQEFTSYVAFRDFLRTTFNDLDDALDAVQSERELVRHGLQIKEEIRAVQSEMMKVRRRRAVAISGATIGSVGAVLVAVYGPAMEVAVAAVGASGGLWGIIHAATENSVRTLRANKWYYVWVLARQHNPDVM